MPLGQLDYSAELSRIAAAKPDAIFAFLPGGMGVNFVKQFRQAGLADKIPFLSAFTVDESTLPAQQDAALGMLAGANWAPNLDNPQNKAFVDAYLKEYNAVPATYAFQAYDAAMLIDSAVRAGQRQSRRQGRAARGAEEGRLQVAARRLQIQQQPLSDPGLLPGQGRQAAGRQVRDRDRQERVLELRRLVRQGLRDEVEFSRAAISSPLKRRDGSAGREAPASGRRVTRRSQRLDCAAKRRSACRSPGCARSPPPPLRCAPQGG